MRWHCVAGNRRWGLLVWSQPLTAGMLSKDVLGPQPLLFLPASMRWADNGSSVSIFCIILGPKQLALNWYLWYHELRQRVPLYVNFFQAFVMWQSHRHKNWLTSKLSYLCWTRLTWWQSTKNEAEMTLVCPYSYVLLKRTLEFLICASKETDRNISDTLRHWCYLVLLKERKSSLHRITMWSQNPIV
jgi:hypothetical protein